ncbi:MAG: amidohydrolase [Deltaproteobacteria bacterium]|nr:amidohydrolase [Deltaproteobacteria bacterium]
MEPPAHPVIIDLHTHIFPPEIVAEREKFFPGEPAFRLLYENPQKSPLATAEDLIAALDRSGLAGAVTFGFPWRQPDLIRRGNDYVLESVARYPDRLRGFACVNPELPDAVAEAERCLGAGLQGIGELALYAAPAVKNWSECFRPLAGLAGERGLPLLLHTNEPVGHCYPGKERLPVWELYDLIRSFPETLFILAHWGGGLWWYQLLKREVREVLHNVFVDTAASPFLYRPEIYRYAIEIFGAHKILYGSDYPLLPVDRYLKEMAAARIEEPDRLAILGGNAQRILRWPRGSKLD